LTVQRPEIPEDVLRFLERRIDSVPHLETLLLLWENPAVMWSEADIARRVYVSTEQARTILLDLARHRFIAAASPGSYSFDVAWDTEKIMQQVAACYRRQLVHVASLIHAKAASEAVRDFARAFQFKRED
jgi:hypothetical protein